MGVASGRIGGCRLWVDVADVLPGGRSGSVMKERVGGSRRLPASAWLFDSGLALVAAGLSTAFFVELLGGSCRAGRSCWATGLCCCTPCRWRAAAVSGTVLGIRCRQRAGVRGPWAAPGGSRGGHPGGGLLGGGLRRPVGVAGRPGRRRARLGGRPAHPGQVPSSDAGQQCAGHWRRVATGPLRLSAAPTPSSWSGPPSWSGPGRSWPAGRWPRSGCAWPASCMTWSRTPSA